MIYVDGNGFEHSLQSTKEKNELGISYWRNTEYKGMAVVSQFQITAKSSYVKSHRSLVSKWTLACKRTLHLGIANVDSLKVGLS